MHRSVTMNLKACTGCTDSSTTSHPNSARRSPSRIDKYYGKKFFDDKNYKSILECLDGEQQPLLSSYNTTKRTQCEIVRAPERHAELIKVRVKNIEEIIVTYRTQVEQMYPRTHFSFTHKHHRTDVMRNLFKAAYALLSDSLNKLEQLRQKKKEIEIAQEDDDSQYQAEQQETLEIITEKIERAQKVYNQEKETYRKRAKQYYEDCQRFEKERLDLIQETLLKFIKAAFSFESVTEQRQIYEDLVSMLKIQQNSLVDLNFWAQNYGVYD
ncbi:unnamed protein product [Rotaria sordida]|uniref:Uncharacterized protein n=1 Tax=Rotaria sordida TaxID=392033 RepID=A0A818HNX5_9BILA|nr:unnamed protein product [Rotaria sordida]CAF3507228.1 unnamed protein product [Rotaria sordida]